MGHIRSDIELELDLDSFLTIKNERGPISYEGHARKYEEYEVVYLLGVEVERYEYDMETYECDKFDQAEIRKRAERAIRKLWALAGEED